MRLSGFPNELLLCIAEELTSEKDISAFMRANRHLYILLKHHLYRFNFRHSKSSALKWAAAWGDTETVKIMLDLLRPVHENRRIMAFTHQPFSLARRMGQRAGPRASAL